MRPRKRFWRFAFYAGLTGCALTLAAYAVSARWITTLTTKPGCSVFVISGLVFFNYSGDPQTTVQPPDGWFRLGGHEVPMAWNFGRVRGQYFAMPLWAPLLAFGSLTTFAFFRSRQQQLPGRCRSCNYDLTGNTTGRCPECGAAVGA